MWNDPAELWISKKLMNPAKTCVSKNRVRVGDESSAFFAVNSGLKQEDALSLLLFNIALESLLASADDLDIVGNSTIMVKEVFIKL